MQKAQLTACRHRLMPIASRRGDYPVGNRRICPACSTAAPRRLNTSDSGSQYMPLPPSQVNLGGKARSQATGSKRRRRNWLRAGYCSSIMCAVTDLSGRMTAAKTYSCTHRFSTGIRTSLLRVQRWNSRSWPAIGDGKHSPRISSTMNPRTIFFLLLLLLLRSGRLRRPGRFRLPGRHLRLLGPHRHLRLLGPHRHLRLLGRHRHLRRVRRAPPRYRTLQTRTRRRTTSRSATCCRRLSSGRS
jgi:hypothetical protein